MDFAIVELSGKQYKITDSCDIEIEHMDLPVGNKITFDKVLMIVDGDKTEIGTPYIEGKTFEAEVLQQSKGKKIKILRFRAKSRHRRRVGFRPQITKLAFGVKKIVEKNKPAESKIAKAAKEVKGSKKSPVKASVKQTAKKTK